MHVLLTAQAKSLLVKAQSQTRNNWNKFKERRIRKRGTTGASETTGTSLKNRAVASSIYSYIRVHTP